MKKKIGIIGTNGLPGKYGGWDQLVNHLTKNLQDEFDFIVYTSYTNYDPLHKIVNNALIHKINFKANGAQSVPYDIMSIFHAVRKCDVLFICGTSGCISLPIAKLYGKKIILNPDGQEWMREKWSKPVKWFLKLSEKLGILNSDIIVADNKIIKDYIIIDYKKDSVQIEYGGDHVLKIPMGKETEIKYNIVNKEYAFKVCRIVPENNIDLILEAFKEVPSIDLVLIGNWEFSDYGLDLLEKYKSYANLKLLTPIYNQQILDELRSNCKIYVHGHSVGGTNPSLVEAMNLGLCIFSFDISYNKETTENKAFYYKDKAELKQLLLQSNLADFNNVSIAMKEIATRRYTWDKITSKYAKIFR
jgi:glycosyltransferase involved in cell wall biosynthesis